ncbi:hypothetical protein CLV28_1007 [Sediminihabitans luteus]|uniref:Uncharacterized protein n=1 Tax=Sediminihabitans luteus TaxID=1138585 RepID=A0A2M9D0Q6_9CELL|nr:hypothetical protein [Sediminihabitans luteus]PJJ77781.1 hypothetical protein CLV28_1007 [Sediminihabitans luteus]
MPATLDRPLRLARTAVVATLVLALSATGHVLAGGTLPGVVGAVALAAVTLAVVAAASRWTTTAARLVLVLAVGQAGLHRGMSMLGGAVPCAPDGLADPHAAHAGTALVGSTLAGSTALGAGSPVAVCAPSPVGMLTHGDPAAMLVAHAVAALVAGVLVARGEQAVRGLAAWIALRVPAATPPGVVRPVLRARVRQRPRLVRARTAVLVRGPPRAPAPAL